MQKTTKKLAKKAKNGLAVLLAPENISVSVTGSRPSVFLAGSIEMGTAENWQNKVIAGLAGQTAIVLNPRRDDWDSSWKQEIENQKFSEQVNWELDAMALAETIAMYFSPGTKSPITLLEFGLYADSGKLIVCCPKGFWRKGNIDIVCKRSGITTVDTLDEMISRIKTRIRGKTNEKRMAKRSLDNYYGEDNGKRCKRIGLRDQ